MDKKVGWRGDRVPKKERPPTIGGTEMAGGVSYGQSGGSGVSEATTIIGPARGSAYAREK